MNILAIGNSFSEDATRYLYSVARADGEKIEVVNLYIGGCSLERHYRNMLSGERAYELQYNGHKTKFSVSLSEALLNRSWDIITVQQASHLSFDRESYVPYLPELAAFVRKCAPKAKIYVHQTWAYEAGSDKLLKVAGYDTPKGMLRDVARAYSHAADSIGADGIIRSGELFGKLANAGIGPIHRDTFHASRGVGRYALALIWYRTLMQKDVIGNSFCDLDEQIPDELITKIQKCVDTF